MWRGAIQFGLVTIPVKLYLATESSSIGFNLLHEKDLSRIQMKIYCPEDDEVIPRPETGPRVRVGQGALRRPRRQGLRGRRSRRSARSRSRCSSTRTARGGDRVREAGLLPGAGPDRSQGIGSLRQVLADEGRRPICKIVLKDREQLAALNPYTKTMLLTTLHWPDEVRSLDELDIPDEEIEVKPAERKMAEQLVASMSVSSTPRSITTTTARPSWPSSRRRSRARRLRRSRRRSRRASVT
jgi:DNA end-binding protein Ku